MNDTITNIWPEVPAEPTDAHPTVDQALFQGKVDAAKARLDRGWEQQKRTEDRTRAVEDKATDQAAAEADRDADEDVSARKAAWDAEYDREKTIHDARVEITKGSLERAYNGAEFIRNASAGILAIYQALLAVRYAVDHTVLPLAGIVPAVFLATSLSAAAAYVAMIGKSRGVPAPKPDASMNVYQERRLNSFIDWVAQQVLSRSYWLHLAVIALFLGSSTIPLAFVTLQWQEVAGVIVVGLLIALVLSWFTTGNRVRVGRS
jgi:hypothetical protein